MERGEILSELKSEKKILKLIIFIIIIIIIIIIILMMKTSQEFPVFVGRQKWTSTT